MTSNDEREIKQQMLDRIAINTLATEKMCLQINLESAVKSGNELLKIQMEAALQTISNIELSLGAMAWMEHLRFPPPPERSLTLVVNNK